MSHDRDAALEEALQRGIMPGISERLGDGSWLLPDYHRSLANVPATLATLLGAAVGNMQPPAPADYWGYLAAPVQRVVLVLVDALGYLYLRQMMDDARAAIWRDLAGMGTLLPMTAICPSTTATSLATLMTGASPAEHGLLGYELWLREFGVLAEMLTMKPVYGAGDETLAQWGMDPTRLLPVPTLAETMGDQGVETICLVAEAYRNSSLSQALYRGVGRLVGYEDVRDLWRQLRRLLEEPVRERQLLLGYWGGLDTAIHLHGTARGAWQAAWADFTQAMHLGLADLPTAARKNTVLVITADHGFVDSPVEAAIDPDEHRDLQDALLIPFSGESRLAFLHTVSAVAEARLRESLAPAFAVLDVQDALEAGLFGPGEPMREVTPRLGNLLAIARGSCYLDRLNRRQRLRGRHGGLSPEEMLIPWLATRLDA